MADHAAAETAPAEQKPFALVGYFEKPSELYHACERMRDAGFKKMDAHTPFAVHGLERAMGLPPSKLPWIVIVGALAGFAGILWLQWWTHAVDYPRNISGKPMFPWQPYVPITFEITVLISSFACFFGMWAILNKLPNFTHPTFQHPSFHRASDDLFFISVEPDGELDLARARKLLEELGAKELQEVMQ